MATRTIRRAQAAYILLITAIVAFTASLEAEVRTWRVGDVDHPWTIAPVSGLTTWGQGWAVEVVADDDGDGLVDEDPFEFIDNDGDGLVNEDGPNPQIDNDGDGLFSEDPVNGRDDDGDGLIDEDASESVDDDLDGLIDEDGPDPQIDNDGDGLLNEDGLMTFDDDDGDGLYNEDPINGRDDDGDGLIDEDAPLPVDGPSTSSTALRPVRLDSTRNLSSLIYARYLYGEYGGVSGTNLNNPTLNVPGENGVRREQAKPTGQEQIIDGDLSTASILRSLGLNLKGFYHIDRLLFRPRPILPEATVADYLIRHGDPESIKDNVLRLRSNPLVPQTFGQYEPVVKDLRFDPPVLMGSVLLSVLTPTGSYSETAELSVFGRGFASDGSYVSEMIDVGTPTPRVRRYSRQWDLFSNADRQQTVDQFPNVEGGVVNWGRVRWRGQRLGEEGQVRIQFRAGNALDTHVYARRIAPGLVDTRDELGRPLDAFTWAKLLDKRIEEENLQYNILGADLGPDGEAGWSFWSAPLRFEDGLVTEEMPPAQRQQTGVPLPLPSGTRYLQFRITFVGAPRGGVALDYIEFDYGEPLMRHGAVAEIYPERVAIGEDVLFTYVLKPIFSRDDTGHFSGVEIDVPSAQARVENFSIDGVSWQDISDAATGKVLEKGQFTQVSIVDSTSGQARLFIGLPPLTEADFRFDETIIIRFRTRLFGASQQFTARLRDSSLSSVAQPVIDGDASAEIATNSVQVVATNVSHLSGNLHVTHPTFTPNGDGLNDTAQIDFDLLLVTDSVDAALEIYALSGQRVRRIVSSVQRAGPVRIEWDGRDEQGLLLPPGLYVYRLRIDGDASTQTRTGLLGLAY